MNDDPRICLIPVDAIRVVNPRSRDKKKFERVVESIATVGLKKPITVTRSAPRDDGSETFNLVCGQGRLEAFVALGQKEIPALVRGMSKSDGLLASLIENIARRRVRTLDQVRLIQWMQEQGQGFGEIAQKTGLGVEYVKDILGMLKKGKTVCSKPCFTGKFQSPSQREFPERRMRSRSGFLWKPMNRRK